MTNHEAVMILCDMGEVESDRDKRKALMRGCMALMALKTRVVDLMEDDYADFIGKGTS